MLSLHLKKQSWIIFDKKTILNTLLLSDIEIQVAIQECRRLKI